MSDHNAGIHCNPPILGWNDFFNVWDCPVCGTRWIFHFETTTWHPEDKYEDKAWEHVFSLEAKNREKEAENKDKLPKGKEGL